MVIQSRHRKADDVVVVSFDGVDVDGGAALDAVGAGFVEAVAGGDVVFDFCFGHGVEGYFCFFGEAFGSDAVFFFLAEGDAGEYAVGSAGEEVKHDFGFFGGLGFTEDFAVAGYYGVCAYHDGTGCCFLCHVFGFLPG